MSRIIIHTDQAPAAIGPYSQAVVSNGIAYLSGQVGLKPGEIPPGPVPGTLTEQAKQVMQNLEAVLTASGSSFDRVIKTSIFLAPDQDFGTVNDIYKTHFSGDFPARETVWVHELPKQALVEISMIALVGE